MNNFPTESENSDPDIENMHPRYEVAGLGAMTQLTELHVMVPFVHEQGDLQSLTGLRRLALDYLPYRWGYRDETTYHKFMFPEAASITKLRLSMHPEVGSSPLTLIESERASERLRVVINKKAKFCT